MAGTGRWSRRTTLLGLVWLSVTLSLQNPLFPIRHASASTCSQAYYSASNVELRVSACLDPSIVEPTSFLYGGMYLTNLSPTSLTLRGLSSFNGFTGFPFRVAIFNSSGNHVGTLGAGQNPHSMSFPLEAGASESSMLEAGWGWSPSSFGATVAPSVYFAQAILDVTVLFKNGTVLFGNGAVSAPMIPFLVAQLLLPFDVFEGLILALLGVIVIIFALHLREMRRFQKSFEHLLERQNTAETQPPPTSKQPKS